tara:strand:- start:1834 stop:2217 length:384 start_codon:yes stop_codon:yes gene_type:complete
MNRKVQRILIVMLPKWLAILILIGIAAFYSDGCASVPSSTISTSSPSIMIDGEFVDEIPVRKKATEFPLKDVRNKYHKYALPTIMYHNETLTQYCMIHHEWEIIKAMYVHSTDSYSYVVSIHSKSWK